MERAAPTNHRILEALGRATTRTVTATATTTTTKRLYEFQWNRFEIRTLTRSLFPQNLKLEVNFRKKRAQRNAFDSTVFRGVLECHGVWIREKERFKFRRAVRAHLTKLPMPSPETRFASSMNQKGRSCEQRISRSSSGGSAHGKATVMQVRYRMLRTRCT